MAQPKQPKLVSLEEAQQILNQLQESINQARTDKNHALRSSLRGQTVVLNGNISRSKALGKELVELPLGLEAPPSRADTDITPPSPELDEQKPIDGDIQPPPPPQPRTPTAPESKKTTSTPQPTAPKSSPDTSTAPPESPPAPSTTTPPPKQAPVGSAEPKPEPMPSRASTPTPKSPEAEPGSSSVDDAPPNPPVGDGDQDQPGEPPTDPDSMDQPPQAPPTAPDIGGEKPPAEGSGQPIKEPGVPTGQQPDDTPQTQEDSDQQIDGETPPTEPLRPEGDEVPPTDDKVEDPPEPPQEPRDDLDRDIDQALAGVESDQAKREEQDRAAQEQQQAHQKADFERRQASQISSSQLSHTPRPGILGGGGSEQKDSSDEQSSDQSLLSSDKSSDKGGISRLNQMKGVVGAAIKKRVKNPLVALLLTAFLTGSCGLGSILTMNLLNPLTWFVHKNGIEKRFHIPMRNPIGRVLYGGFKDWIKGQPDLDELQGSITKKLQKAGVTLDVDQGAWKRIGSDGAESAINAAEAGVLLNKAGIYDDILVGSARVKMAKMTGRYIGDAATEADKESDEDGEEAQVAQEEIDEITAVYDEAKGNLEEELQDGLITAEEYDIKLAELEDDFTKQLDDTRFGKAVKGDLIDNLAKDADAIAVLKKGAKEAVTSPTVWKNALKETFKDKTLWFETLIQAGQGGADLFIASLADDPDFFQELDALESGDSIAKLVAQRTIGAMGEHPEIIFDTLINMALGIAAALVGNVLMGVLGGALASAAATVGLGSLFAPPIGTVVGIVIAVGSLLWAAAKLYKMIKVALRVAFLMEFVVAEERIRGGQSINADMLMSSLMGADEGESYKNPPPVEDEQGMQTYYDGMSDEPPTDIFNIIGSMRPDSSGSMLAGLFGSAYAFDFPEDGELIDILYWEIDHDYGKESYDDCDKASEDTSCYHALRDYFMSPDESFTKTLQSQDFSSHYVPSDYITTPTSLEGIQGDTYNSVLRASQDADTSPILLLAIMDVEHGCHECRGDIPTGGTFDARSPCTACGMSQILAPYTPSADPVENGFVPCSTPDTDGDGRCEERPSGECPYVSIDALINAGGNVWPGYSSKVADPAESPQWTGHDEGREPDCRVNEDSIYAMAHKVAPQTQNSGSFVGDPLSDEMLTKIANSYSNNMEGYADWLIDAYNYYLPSWENPIVKTAIQYVPSNGVRYRPASLWDCTKSYDSNYTLEKRADNELCGGNCASRLDSTWNCGKKPVWCWQFAGHVINTALGTNYVNPEDGGRPVSVSSKDDLSKLVPGDLLIWSVTSVDGGTWGHYNLYMGQTDTGMQMMDGNWGNRVEANSLKWKSDLTLVTSSGTTLKLTGVRRYLPDN